MTRVLWLAHENAFFSFDVSLSPQDLLVAVNRGDWQPPPGIMGLLSQEARATKTPLHGVRLGNLVVIYPSGLEKEEADYPLHEVRLSEKQRLVLQGLAEGLSLKAIARRLEISPSTVAAHIRSIKRHLKCHTLAQAILRGTALGLCNPEEGTLPLFASESKPKRNKRLRSASGKRLS